jgi:hypothetical protein
MAHGADACSAGFFCEAFDGRTVPVCYPNLSRLGGETCSADEQCLSMSCNTTVGACRAAGPEDCTAEIGCAPFGGIQRACATVAGVHACHAVGDGSLGALCGDDTHCNTGLTCDLTRSQCAPCARDSAPVPARLDVLFVVDNSNSMAEEQARFVAGLPRFVGGLASGDRDGDGVADFTPPESVHLAVVTTDMGSAGFDVPTCRDGTFGARFGDDGVLISRARSSMAGCATSYPSFLEFGAGASTSAVVADLACVATVGTAGCGFEQQLEAMLKAVSPSSPQAWTAPDYVPPTFFGGTSGHGSDENAGFLRDDSALAIVILTDDDDASVRDPDLLDVDSSRYDGDLTLRAFRYPGALHSFERYVGGTEGTSGLLGVRRSPDQILFAVIAGIPADAISNPAAPDLAAILAHPQMQERIDPGSSSRLAFSCTAAGVNAVPPRRIVQVAQGVAAAGGRVTVGSICQDSYAATFDALLASLSAAPGCSETGPTGAELGADCTANEECASGLCGTIDGVSFCTQPCVDSCAMGFSCTDGYCQPPRGSGSGCSVAPAGQHDAAAAWLVALTTLAIGFGRRRWRMPRRLAPHCLPLPARPIERDPSVRRA